MFGSILSSITKVVTSPLDAANSVLDYATGGDGSKSSRQDLPLSGDVERIRDALAKLLKDADK